MIVLGIDPGPHTSGVCVYDAINNRVLASHPAVSLAGVFEWLRFRDPRFEAVALEFHGESITVAIEAIEAMYAHVGKDTVRTIHDTGRIHQDALRLGHRVTLMSPQAVKRVVCGTASAKDPAVRQALLDQVGPQGRKADRGPTYGVKSHAWRALAVAVAASMQMGEEA